VTARFQSERTENKIYAGDTQRNSPPADKGEKVNISEYNFEVVEQFIHLGGDRKGQ
jgi:hypothetical protein